MQVALINDLITIQDKEYKIGVTTNIYSERLKNAFAEVYKLPSSQRKALLLSLKDEGGDTLIKQLLVVKVITIGQLVRALEVSEEEFWSIFPRLPLMDLELSQYLNCTQRQLKCLLAVAAKAINQTL
jgi:hypothetical protein